MRSETARAFSRPDSNGLTSRRNVAVALAIVALFAALSAVRAQTTNEFWPDVRVHIDLHPRIGLQIYGEKQSGEELPSAKTKGGATVTYRVKRLFKPLLADPDPENQYLATLGIGYEHLRQKKRNGEPVDENRLIFEATPRYTPGAGFLFLNRQRAEFRWNGGVYDFRYRFKVTGQHAFKVDAFHFTPYVSGELFWDRNHHSWNENQYAFGVQFPFRGRFMLETYLLHQNCTTCGQHSVNAFGLSGHFYIGHKK